jgi:hypothetical protein
MAERRKAMGAEAGDDHARGGELRARLEAELPVELDEQEEGGQGGHRVQGDVEPGRPVAQCPHRSVAVARHQLADADERSDGGDDDVVHSARVARRADDAGADGREAHARRLVGSDVFHESVLAGGLEGSTERRDVEPGLLHEHLLAQWTLPTQHVEQLDDGLVGRHRRTVRRPLALHDLEEGPERISA